MTAKAGKKGSIKSSVVYWFPVAEILFCTSDDGNVVSTATRVRIAITSGGRTNGGTGAPGGKGISGHDGMTGAIGATGDVGGNGISGQVGGPFGVGGFGIVGRVGRRVVTQGGVSNGGMKKARAGKTGKHGGFGGKSTTRWRVSKHFILQALEIVDQPRIG